MSSKKREITNRELAIGTATGVGMVILGDAQVLSPFLAFVVGLSGEFVLGNMAVKGASKLGKHLIGHAEADETQSE